MNNKISIISLSALVTLIGSSDLNAMGIAQQAASKVAQQTAASPKPQPQPTLAQSVASKVVTIAQQQKNFVFVNWQPDNNKGYLYPVGTTIDTVKKHFGTHYGAITGSAWHKRVDPAQLIVYVNNQKEQASDDYILKSGDTARIEPTYLF